MHVVDRINEFFTIKTMVFVFFFFLLLLTDNDTKINRSIKIFQIQ